MCIKKGLLLVFIYLCVWFTLTETKVFNQTDSLWSIYTTISLVREGNIDLDEYASLFPKAFHANLTTYNGHTYNYYPYGVSLLAAPHIWILNQWYAWKGKNLSDKVIASSTIGLEKNISSSLLSLSACIFFLISLHLTNSMVKSLETVFIFSFCTLVFSTVSRGLWQHSGSILLLSLTLYGFLTERKQWMILSAIPLFFSYVVRPTNLLPIVFFSLIAIYRLKLKSVFFLGQGFLVLSIFFYINFLLFGSIVHPYYDFRKVSGSDSFYEALVANLFSPGRGLFIYSPIFIFSIYGIYLKKKMEKLSVFDYAIFSIVILHWILVSRNLNWWGGHSYGYRLLSDTIPFFIYYLIFSVQYIDKRTIMYGFLLFTLLISFYINFKGAQYMETYLWNLVPDNIDTNSARNWNWKDFPFLR
ncbi:MAG: hypothetical protein IPG24_24595 [Leptospiraceae bacterium]|nr:hypothetical protein [Leptospiraceae bacterium]